jgi:hypothetical protein
LKNFEEFTKTRKEITEIISFLSISRMILSIIIGLRLLDIPAVDLKKIFKKIQ